MPDWRLDSGGGGSGSSSVTTGTVIAEDYVEGGEILIGKLISTALGAIWLTVAGGWIAIVDAIVSVHVALLLRASEAYVSVIEAIGSGGEETLRVGWAAAFRSAVEADPLLAPIILTLELTVVAGIALTFRRRLL